MSDYTKLVVLLNPAQPSKSKVVEESTGKEVPVDGIQIGLSAAKYLTVQLTISEPFVRLAIGSDANTARFEREIGPSGTCWVCGEHGDDMGKFVSGPGKPVHLIHQTEKCVTGAYRKDKEAGE